MPPVSHRAVGRDLSTPPKLVLTIAGSDPSGGAGIQGDLRTFSALGVHGLSVITMLTAQGTRGVRRVVPVEAELVWAQLDALFEDLAVDAVKLGALATGEIARRVADVLERRPETPLIVDPVIVSSSGAAMLDDDGIATLVERLLPRAVLTTPNTHELARLAGIQDAPTTIEEVIDAARVLLRRGGRAILGKGGHLPGDPTDVLVTRDYVRVYRGDRVESECTHGTGCTLAAAIAAEVAKGSELDDAIRLAKEFVAGAIAHAVPIGPGKSPLNHMFRQSRQRREEGK